MDNYPHQYISQIRQNFPAPVRVRGRREHEVQRAVVSYLESYRPDLDPLGWFHCPNEEPNEKRRQFAKLMGVKRGISDLIFIKQFTIGRVWFAGLALELKLDRTSRLTADQTRFLNYCRSQGWIAEAAWGFNQALEIIHLCYGEQSIRANR